MRQTSLLVLMVLLAGCGKSGVRGEQERLRGVWSVARLEDDGLVIPPQLRSGFDVKIDEAQISLNIGARQLKAVYILHPNNSPAGIDLEKFDRGSKGPAMVWKGIYRFQGERLELCVAGPDHGRPTEFKTSPNSGRILLVLERSK